MMSYVIIFPYLAKLQSHALDLASTGRRRAAEWRAQLADRSRPPRLNKNEAKIHLDGAACHMWPPWAGKLTNGRESEQLFRRAGRDESPFNAKPESRFRTVPASAQGIL
jgi:hypothetical protein